MKNIFKFSFLPAIFAIAMFSCKGDDKETVIKVGNVTFSITPAITGNTLTVDDAHTVEVVITPENATDKGVTLASSATDVISVTAITDGWTIKALKAGASKLTATANDGSGKFVSLDLTVKDKAVVVTELTVTVAGSPYAYTGNPIVPNVTVKAGTATLAATDYDLSYSAGGNTNAGEVTVTATGKTGDYAGKKGEAKFVISPKADAQFVVTIGGTFTYDGTAKIPIDITVKWDEKTLVATTDYTVAAPANNTNAGTVSVNITGAGNFAGSTGSGAFTIDPCPINVKADDKSKSIGEADPPLTCTTTPTLFGADAFTGALTRAAGEREGTYAITQGTLAASNNFTISFTPGVFTVQGYFCGGSGTSVDPYLICTAAQLAKMAELVNGKATNSEYSNKYYKLTADIDLSAYGKDWNNGKGWIPIGKYMPSQADRCPFIGHFDGNNHKVSGLFMNVDNLSTCNGLFGYMTGGSLQNLGVDGAVTGGGLTGGLVGQIHIVSITNCYAAVTVNGFDNVGGLVGQSDGNITNCYATGAVSGVSSQVGGLIGVNSGNISNCFATGVVSSLVGMTGGLVGYLIESGSVINCYATGDVSGFSSVGGLVGFIMRNEGSVTNCYATGAVNGGGYGIRGGGVVGNNNGGISSIANCAALNSGITNTGSLPSFGRVTGFSYSGGTNNVAWDGMKAIGGITFGAGTADNNDGFSIDKTATKTQTTYSGSGANQLGWTFGSSAWKMGTGTYLLPVLYWQEADNYPAMPAHLAN